MFCRGRSLGAGDFLIDLWVRVEVLHRLPSGKGAVLGTVQKKIVYCLGWKIF